MRRPRKEMRRLMRKSWRHLRKRARRLVRRSWRRLRKSSRRVMQEPWGDTAARLLNGEEGVSQRHEAYQREAIELVRRSHWTKPPKEVGPVDLDPKHVATIKRVSRFTMTPDERIAALCGSVEYLVENDIGGSFVECGVWRGGSMMAAALTLARLGRPDRDLYLFDTFAGMTEATEADVDYQGTLKPAYVKQGALAVPVQEVREALVTTGYDQARVHLVAGDVKETLPERAPPEIALMRLDTDFYESTRHELTHLYPRLAVGGVLIIDDYGHFRGQRQAVDEYFEGVRIMLHRIDYSARIAIKQQL